MLEERVEVVSTEILALDARISGMQASLDQLLLRFTDKHPDVRATAATMADLQAQRDAATERAMQFSGPAPSMSGALNQSTFYQEMKIQIAGVESEIAALKARRGAFQEQVDELERAVDTIPEIEAELKRLDRDYGLNREQYGKLVERREAAKISEEAEETTDDIQLKVIEPPKLPLIPIGPPRLQFFSAVFVASLIMGGAVALLMSQINPCILSVEDLKTLAGIPVMGAVSMVSSQFRNNERRMEVAFFCLVLIGLFGCYGAIMLLQLNGVELHEEFQKILGERA